MNAEQSSIQKTHTISILFSTYTDFVSRLISFVSGFKCTHVSISLDDNDEYFYAFNTKGFRKEYPRKHKRRTSQNSCLRLQVTDEQYNHIKGQILKFEHKQKKYSYDYLGIILCMFRLHRKPKPRKFFCSSFVAYILNKAKVIKLQKTNTGYLPYQLQRELLLCPLLIGKTSAFSFFYINKKDR